MNADAKASSRRADPDYGQISGLIPKTLIIEFKVALARSGMNQSEAMEVAIALWVKAA